jgi:hypothetical protein
MDYSIYRLNLDVKTNRSQALLKVFKGDTAVKLVCMLTDGGRVFQIEDGNVATITLTMPDGSKPTYTCYIRDNSIVYPFTSDTTNLGTSYAQGMIEAQLNVYGGVVNDTEGNPIYSQTLATPKFSIEVSATANKPTNPIFEGIDASVGIVLGAAAKEYAREQAENAREENEAARQESYENAINTANEAVAMVESVGLTYDNTTGHLIFSYTKDGVKEDKPVYLQLESAVVNIEEYIDLEGKPYLILVLANGNKSDRIYLDDIFKGFVPVPRTGAIFGDKGAVVVKDSNGQYRFVICSSNGAGGAVVVSASTGHITSAVNPQLPNHVTNKSYVDTVGLNNLTATINKVNALKDELEPRFEQLESATLKYTEFSGVTDAVPVPVNAAKHVPVYKVGGMTYKSANLIPFPYKFGSTVTKNGITATVQEDGSILVNGTNTLTDSSTGITLASGITNSDTIILSGCPSGGSVSTYRLRAQSGSAVIGEDMGEGFVISPQTSAFDLMIIVGKSCTVNNLVYRPMLNYGTTALPYSPYFEGLRDTKVTELVSEGANLIPYPYNTYAIENGITFTDNGDGSIILNGKNNGTANSVFYMHKTQTPITLKAGTYSNGGDVNITLFDYINNKYYSLSMGTTLTLDKDVTCGLYIQIQKGDTKEYKNFVVHPMINYGTTAAPYKPYRGTIDTLPISAELRTFLADKGYGRGVEGRSNYLDYERKVFVQNCASVNMGTLSFALLASASNDNRAIFMAKISGMYKTKEMTEIPLILCPAYKTVMQKGDWYVGDISQAINNETVYCCEPPNTTLEEFMKKIKGVELVYALAEPIEYDISAYITDDEIEVEGGGAIIPVNEYNNPAFVEMLFTEKK